MKNINASLQRDTQNLYESEVEGAEDHSVSTKKEQIKDGHSTHC